MAASALVVFCMTILQVINAQSLTEYIVPLLDIGADSQYNLVIVNNNAFPITVDEILIIRNVTKRDEAHTIDVNNRHTISCEIDQPDLMNGSNILRSRFYFSSSNYFTLRVVYYARTDPHQEGFLAVPNAHLGNKYYVSTFCDLGGFCQIAVASSVSGTTQVYIKLPEVVDEIAVCVGNLTWHSKTDTTILLEYPEVLQLETTYDITGSYIYTDNPVGVLAATRSLESKYHYVEQLVPVDHWGSDFVVRALGTYGNIIHITASQRKTVVKMSGYPTVELTTSQTIRRLIDIGAVNYIQSSKPVQVVLYKGLAYATQDPFVNPGMTLVPSLQHESSSTIVACNENAPMSLVATTEYDVTFSVSSSILINSSMEQVVPYEFYKVHIIETLDTYSITANGLSYRAILTCNDEAVFPATLPVLSTPACVSNVALMYPGDGIDNDCSDQSEIDEDPCFENRLYEHRYSPYVDDVIQPEIVTFGSFQLIKLRVKTCGSVQIEIREANYSRLVIHISKSAMSMYECFDSCNVSQEMDITSYLRDLNCDKDYAFYWVRRSYPNICVGVGPFPPVECPLTNVLLYQYVNWENFAEMRLNGLMTDATFYYDVYKNDCGKLESDWRCDDSVTNCHEYQDICNDVRYTNWVQTNCQKYCGMCSPDSFGRMFVIAHPHNLLTTYEYNTAIAPTVVVRRDGTAYGIGVAKTNCLELTADVETYDPNSNQTHTATTTYSRGSSQNEMYIFSDTDSIVHSSLSFGEVSAELFVQPIDALSTEYMLAFFHGPISCTVISPEGVADVWTFTKGLTHEYKGQAAPYKQNIYLTDLDPTGVVIRANIPIAVFCGSSVNTWTQLPATNTWGVAYQVPIYISHADTNKNYNVKARIITNRDNTIVQIKGDFDAIYPLYERGDFIDQDLTSNTAYNISANYPILVVLQYYTLYDSDTHSSFQILPAETNIMNDPVLVANLFVTSDIDITVHSSDASIATMVNVSGGHETRLYYEVQGDAFIVYSYVKASLNLTIFGVSTLKYPDMSMHNVWHLTSGTPGDGIDNDVDGLIDEETVCYTGYGVTREDYDLDGGFGEDCLEIAVGTQVRHLAPPKAPTCVTEVPGQYCYTSCTCPCSWVDNLANYENMTEEERVEMFATDFEFYKQQLLLQEGDLSVTKATKISADDTRQSSTNIGYVGIGMVTLVIGLVVAMDFITLVKYIQTRRQNAVAGD